MLTLTADGCQEVATPVETGCCPPPLCGNDLCCTFVAFFNLLPSGLLWDFWKIKAISYFQSSDDPAECPLVKDPQCPSLILHAIYVVLKLKDLVHNALWPALRESNPVTAVTTLDAWLARLRWEDCFLQACRTNLADEITPYEIMGECGPIFCPPDFPPELVAAVKHNIIIALSRANMGVIKNLCGLNWIIAPLGAVIKPLPPLPFNTIPIDPCDAPCRENTAFVVTPTRDWIEGVGSGELCVREDPKVQAWWDRGCDAPAGLPAQIWPALLAAHCIVRSMLPPACPSNVSVDCAWEATP